MSRTDDLCREPLWRQQAALLAGEVNARELLAAQLARIEQIDPLINSYLHVAADAAMRQAEDSAARIAEGRTRSLEGVPVAIKDNLDVRGMPTTAGMATRRGRIAEHDAGSVRRLRAAGAVILGKLNMHEAALGADNDNPHYGRCHNPHRLGFTPGGSSGGSAASVAAGLAAASLGSDSMGSLRIPASYCGIYALKPSRGLVSSAGSVRVCSRLDHVGPMARSARDLRLLLDVLAGEDPDCPASRPLSLLDSSDSPLRLRVMLPAATVLEEGIREDFQRGLDCLREMGHQIEALSDADIDPAPQRRAGLLLCEAEMLAEHAEDWQHRRELFSPQLTAMLAWAEKRSAADVGKAIICIDQARQRVQNWLRDCDGLVSPTTPQRAFAFGKAAPAGQADLTCLASFAGLPAISLPMQVEAGSLPAGLQIVAALGADRRLIALAESWEHMRGGPAAVVEPQA